MALSKESFLPDAEDCAETWRALRWPDGLECGRWFNDRSGTFIESAKVRLPVWVYVLREMDKGRSINSISKDLPHTYKTVHRVATTMREAIYQRREEWREVLTGEIEADDVHLTLGQQGRTLLPEDTPRSKDSDEKAGEKADSGPGATNQSAEAESKKSDFRKPRERGLSERGRGSWARDRPPAVLWAERGGSGRVLELQADVTNRTLLRSAIRHVEPGSRIDTDDFSSYRLLEEIYDHRSVDHEEAYVSEEGTHCNSAEGEWSIFKPWWRGFRGVAKRHAYRQISEYSFRRSHRSDSRQKRLRRMVALLRLTYGPSDQTQTFFGTY